MTFPVSLPPTTIILLPHQCSSGVNPVNRSWQSKNPTFGLVQGQNIIISNQFYHNKDYSENDYDNIENDYNDKQVYLSEGDTDQEEVTFKVIFMIPISFTMPLTSHYCKCSIIFDTQNC